MSIGLQDKRRLDDRFQKASAATDATFAREGANVAINGRCETAPRAAAVDRSVTRACRQSAAIGKGSPTRPAQARSTERRFVVVHEAARAPEKMRGAVPVWQSLKRGPPVRTQVRSAR